MTDQNSLLLDISVLYRNINKYFDKHLMSYKLGSSQLLSLLQIYENEGISMQKLAQITELDKGTTTKSIQKLVDYGYVDIRSDEDDRRIKRLFTTEKTNGIIQELYQIRNDCVRTLSQNLTEEELVAPIKMSENSRVFADEIDSNLKIGGLQKLTLLDYPGKVACTIFTSGCNLKCPFCHNRDLVFVPEQFEYYDSSDILEYLDKRKGILEAVCISGGEPLLQDGIFDFMRKIKEKGNLVKLDTNGHSPKLLKQAIDENLVDYVAMDIKNCWDRYGETTGIDFSPAYLKRFKESIKILMEGRIDYEFRTTVVKTFHTKEDLIKLAEGIRGCQSYYLQTFKDSGNLIDETCMGYNQEEMKELLTAVQEIIPTARLRN